MIIAGASPGETKMWAAVRENGDFFTFVDHVKTNKHMFEFFSPSGSHTILVYRSYTDTNHRAAFFATAELLVLPVRPHISTILHLSSPLAAPVRHLSPHCPDQNHEMHEIWPDDSQENY